MLNRQIERNLKLLPEVKEQRHNLRRIAIEDPPFFPDFTPVEQIPVAESTLQDPPSGTKPEDVSSVIEEEASAREPADAQSPPEVSIASDPQAPASEPPALTAHASGESLAAPLVSGECREAASTSRCESLAAPLGLQPGDSSPGPVWLRFAESPAARNAERVSRPNPTLSTRLLASFRRIVHQPSTLDSRLRRLLHRRGPKNVKEISRMLKKPRNPDDFVTVALL